MKRKRVDDGFDFGLDSSLNLVDLSSIQKAVKNFDQEELNISNIIFEELNWRKQTIQNKSQVKTTDISSIESNDLEKPFSLPITLELLRSKLDLESNSTTNNNNNNNTNTNQYSISSIVSSLLVDGFFQSQEIFESSLKICGELLKGKLSYVHLIEKLMKKLSSISNHSQSTKYTPNLLFLAWSLFKVGLISSFESFIKQCISFSLQIENGENNNLNVDSMDLDLGNEWNEIQIKELLKILFQFQQSSQISDSYKQFMSALLIPYLSLKFPPKQKNETNNNENNDSINISQQSLLSNSLVGLLLERLRTVPLISSIDVVSIVGIYNSYLEIVFSLDSSSRTTTTKSEPILFFDFNSFLISEFGLLIHSFSETPRVGSQIIQKIGLEDRKRLHSFVINTFFSKNLEISLSLKNSLKQELFNFNQHSIRWSVVILCFESLATISTFQNETISSIDFGLSWLVQILENAVSKSLELFLSSTNPNTSTVEVVREAHFILNTTLALAQFFFDSAYPFSTPEFPKFGYWVRPKVFALVSSTNLGAKRSSAARFLLTNLVESMKDEPDWVLHTYVKLIGVSNTMSSKGIPPLPEYSLFTTQYSNVAKQRISQLQQQQQQQGTNLMNSLVAPTSFVDLNKIKQEDIEQSRSQFQKYVNGFNSASDLKNIAKLKQNWFLNNFLPVIFSDLADFPLQNKHSLFNELNKENLIPKPILPSIKQYLEYLEKKEIQANPTTIRVTEINLEDSNNSNINEQPDETILLQQILKDVSKSLNRLPISVHQSIENESRFDANFALIGEVRMKLDTIPNRFSKLTFPKEIENEKQQQPNESDLEQQQQQQQLKKDRQFSKRICETLLNCFLKSVTKHWNQTRLKMKPFKWMSFYWSHLLFPSNVNQTNNNDLGSFLLRAMIDYLFELISKLSHKEETLTTTTTTTTTTSENESNQLACLAISLNYISQLFSFNYSILFQNSTNTTSTSTATTNSRDLLRNLIDQTKLEGTLQIGWWLKFGVVWLKMLIMNGSVIAESEDLSHIETNLIDLSTTPELTHLSSEEQIQQLMSKNGFIFPSTFWCLLEWIESRLSSANTYLSESIAFQNLRSQFWDLSSMIKEHKTVVSEIDSNSLISSPNNNNNNNQNHFSQLPTIDWKLFISLELGMKPHLDFLPSHLRIQFWRFQFSKSLDKLIQNTSNNNSENKGNRRGGLIELCRDLLNSILSNWSKIEHQQQSIDSCISDAIILIQEISQSLSFSSHFQNDWLISYIEEQLQKASLISLEKLMKLSFCIVWILCLLSPLMILHSVDLSKNPNRFIKFLNWCLQWNVVWARFSASSLLLNLLQSLTHSKLPSNSINQLISGVPRMGMIALSEWKWILESIEDRSQSTPSLIEDSMKELFEIEEFVKWVLSDSFPTTNTNANMNITNSQIQNNHTNTTTTTTQFVNLNNKKFGALKYSGLCASFFCHSLVEKALNHIPPSNSRIIRFLSDCNLLAPQHSKLFWSVCLDLLICLIGSIMINHDPPFWLPPPYSASLLTNREKLQSLVDFLVDLVTNLICSGNDSIVSNFLNCFQSQFSEQSISAYVSKQRSLLVFSMSEEFSNVEQLKNQFYLSSTTKNNEENNSTTISTTTPSTHCFVSVFLIGRAFLSETFLNQLTNALFGNQLNTNTTISESEEQKRAMRSLFLVLIEQLLECYRNSNHPLFEVANSQEVVALVRNFLPACWNDLIPNELQQSIISLTPHLLQQQE